MATVSTEPLYHVELIDGREVEKPLPKKLHVFIQTYLVIVLGRDLPKRYRVGSELNVLCGLDHLVPDVTVMKRDARYENGDLAEPPAFCVEILSPGQTIGHLFGRADRLLHAAGTPMCWIIWPERRKAWIYTTEDAIEVHDILAAPLTDGDRIEVSLAEMWAELD